MDGRHLDRIRGLVTGGDLQAARQALLADIARLLERSGRHGRLKRNCLITGPARVGKTLLAQRLAERTGTVALSLDIIREVFWHLRDDARRAQARRVLFEGLLEAFPGRLVLESDDLVCLNRSDRNPAYDPLSLDLAAEWQRRGLARVCVVGCADSSPEQKLGALESWRAKGKCWTETHPAFAAETGLLRLADEIVQTSRTLRDLSRAQGLSYIELGSDDFSGSLEAAVIRIATELGPGTAEPVPPRSTGQAASGPVTSSALRRARQ